MQETKLSTLNKQGEKLMPTPKLFNITAEFDLTKKPDWLNGF